MRKDRPGYISGFVSLAGSTGVGILTPKWAMAEQRAGSGSARSIEAPHEDEDVAPPEDLMREHGVLKKDVARSVAFYTQRLGFTLKHQQLPAFANVSLGGADILLSGPGASGSRPMPNGEHQTSGGWNRVVLKVAISAVHHRPQTGRSDIPQRDGGRSRGTTDPNRRS